MITPDQLTQRKAELEASRQACIDQAQQLSVRIHHLTGAIALINDLQAEQAATAQSAELPAPMETPASNAP